MARDYFWFIHVIRNLHCQAVAGNPWSQNPKGPGSQNSLSPLGTNLLRYGLGGLGLELDTRTKFYKMLSLCRTNNTSRQLLSDEEKLDFVKTAASWIGGRDILNSCFTIHFGYDAPLPWPQV